MELCDIKLIYFDKTLSTKNMAAVHLGCYKGKIHSGQWLGHCGQGWAIVDKGLTFGQELVIVDW